MKKIEYKLLDKALLNEIRWCHANENLTAYNANERSAFVKGLQQARWLLKEASKPLFVQ